MNKTEQRLEIKKRLAVAELDYFTNASDVICKKLIELLNKEKYSCVFSYMPMKREADISKVNSYLTSNNVKIAFPLVQGEIISFYYGNSFVKGSYGILEPEKTNKLVDAKEADIIIVPLVGFDSNKNRLGHGKGYYDRFLTDSKALKIGVAFEIQRLDDVYVEDNDIPLDVIVTEAKIY